jgi:hypothetical protein
VRWAHPVDESNPHGSYAACDACSSRIEQDAKAQLLRRVARKTVRQGQAPSIAQAEALYAPGLETFWRSRRGDRVPVKPDDPIDPAREDTFGRMLRESHRGMELEIHKDDGDLQTTISAESAGTIGEYATAWAMSRVKRKYDQTGEMPQRVKVRIEVELDGRPGSSQLGATGHGPPGPARFVIDGQTRVNTNQEVRDG